MSRTNDGTSGNYLRDLSNTPVTAAPFTFACWAYTTGHPGAGAAFGLMSAANSGRSNDDDWELYIFGASSTCRFLARDTGSGLAETSSGATLSQWNHYCGVESASNSRAAYINGGSKGTDATTKTPDGVNRFGLMLFFDSSVSSNLDGQIAWPAVWDVALSDAEVAALAAGASPLTVRPESLVSFWPLTGASTGDEPPSVGTITLGELNTVGTAESNVLSHPMLIAPVGISAAAPAANPKGPLGHPLHGPLAGPIGP